MALKYNERSGGYFTLVGRMKRSTEKRGVRVALDAFLKRRKLVLEDGYVLIGLEADELHVPIDVNGDAGR